MNQTMRSSFPFLLIMGAILSPTPRARAEWAPSEDLRPLRKSIAEFKGNRSSSVETGAKVTGMSASSNDVADAGPKDPPAPYAVPPGWVIDWTSTCNASEGSFTSCLDFEILSTPDHRHGGSPPGVERTPRCLSGTAPGTVTWRNVKLPFIGAKIKATWSWTGACSNPGKSKEYSTSFDLKWPVENSGYAIGRDWKDHVWPYYAHPDVIKKLDQIGTEYRKNFSYPAFRILAMSLKNGGLLDVKGTWAPPFKYHARGWQVFVAPAEGDTFPDDVAWFFVTNADKYGYNWHPEAVLGAYWLNFSPDRDNQTPALHEDIAAMREHEPALFRK